MDRECLSDRYPVLHLIGAWLALAGVCVLLATALKALGWWGFVAAYYQYLIGMLVGFIAGIVYHINHLR